MSDRQLFALKWVTLAVPLSFALVAELAGSPWATCAFYCVYLNIKHDLRARRTP